MTALWLACSLLAGQDDDVLPLDRVIAEADRLLKEARGAYEAGKEKSSVDLLLEAAFKTELARSKFQAVQEVTRGDRQKSAGEQIRLTNELMRLVNDARAAVKKPTTADTPAPPGAPEAPKPTADPPPPLPPPPVRAAVPDPPKLAEAEKTVRDLYKTEYAKKDPSSLRALARVLLDQSDRSVDDPPARWVLLREARDLASQAGDAATAAEAVEKACAGFDIDVLTLKSVALAAVSKSAKAPEDLKVLAEQFLKVVDDAVSAESYDSAEKAASAAGKAARKAGDAALATRAMAAGKGIADLRSRSEKARKAAESLRTKPGDPAACLEIGRFECFGKGNWDVGLAYLVKGSDTALQKLASADLVRPETPAEQVAVADGWWDVAEKETGAAKALIRKHAVGWYERALPGATSLVRAKIEKRLEEAEPAGTGTVQLLPLIDPKKHQKGGEFQKTGGALVTPEGAPYARVEVPYVPPAEYDVTIVLERVTGTNSFNLGLVADGTRFIVVFDGRKAGDNTYLDELKAGDGAGQLVFVQGKLLEAGRPATLVCNVRKASLTVTLNGRKVVDWKGDYKRLGFDRAWDTPNPQALILGSWSTQYRISKAVLKPVSGQGKILR